MQFTPGSRVGVYEVIAPIASGGMGEVYRARDTVLGRDVALKVLTREASADLDGQSRFENEARAVAALSHPNILAIYSFGSESGVAYAATELLEGRTLREELAQGPLSVRRVLNLGSQMALGLAAAHEKGIIHRDLKPENVFITLEGRVKLLDFGLARTVSTPISTFSATTSRVTAITSTGMLMGSMGYMAPEQVSGMPTDQRSDVFSLGIVLFEMLTAQPPFQRESAIETLHATVSEGPPEIADLTPGVPLPLERIVMRCLEKSPSERFQSARDLAFALLALSGLSGKHQRAVTTSSEVPARRHRRLLVSVAVLVGLTAASVIGRGYWATVRPSPHQVVTFTIPAPSGTALANVPSKMLAISPQGERIVFVVERSGQRELWIRHLDAPNAVALPDTQDATEPFWSPDGQSIGFFAGSKLKRIRADGSMLQMLCDAPLESRGGTWSADGVILFGDSNGGLSRVPATGGSAIPVTTPGREAGQEMDSWPQFLPDGRRFLYLRQKGPSTGMGMGATAHLGTLDRTVERQVLGGVFNALFVAPDLLLFADANAVKVQRIDLDRSQMVGGIEEVWGTVDRHLGRAALAVSQTGTLVYAAGSRDSRVVWVDRKGRETGVVTSGDGWRDVALSPDGSHVAAQRIESEANDIWTIDLVRGVSSRFTFSPDVDDDPVWSPDGTRIAFSSVRDGMPGIYQKLVAGTGEDELLFTNHTSVQPTAWSPDGRFLLFDQRDPQTASDVWVLPAQDDRRAYPFLRTTFSEDDAHFSPDGRWVAYTSDESGRDEVYIQSFPDSRQKLQISTEGGLSPRWAPAGHELYFLAIDRRLMAVRINPANPIQVATPMPLFGTSVGLGANRYAPAHDGQRFLLSLGTATASAAPLVVVVNWAEQLTTTQGSR